MTDIVAVGPDKGAQTQVAAGVGGARPEQPPAAAPRRTVDRRETADRRGTAAPRGAGTRRGRRATGLPGDSWFDPAAVTGQQPRHRRIPGRLDSLSSIPAGRRTSLTGIRTGRLASLTSAGTGRNWKVLQDPRFRLYFAGSLVSNLGTWLQNTAQVLLAYQLTHSVFWVGIVTCAQFSGSLFLGPLAAVVADRIGGRRMLITTQLFSAAVAGCLAWLEFTGVLTDRILMIGALLLGLAFTFALPVQMAMIPRLLPDEDTEAGLAMNSVSYNAGRAVAPLLSIAVISTVGFSAVFAVNAISFIIFAIFLLFAHTQKHSRSAHQEQPPRQARAWDGIKIACQRPRIWLLLLMVAAVTLADDPVLVLGPALAHHALHTSSDWAGYFLAALGGGTILGSLAPTKVTTADASKKSKRAAASLLMLAVCMLVFVRGFSPQLSLVAAFLAGAAALLTGAATQALLVRESPGHTDSVMALWAIAWAGTKPLASLLDGWLASRHGLLIAGCVVIAPAVCLSAIEIGLPRPIRARLKDRHAGWREERPEQPELAYAAARP